AMHIQRLIGYSRNPAAADALTDTVRELRERAGISEEDAEATDLITNMCDRIAFDFCFEQPDEGALELPTRDPRERVRVSYSIDGNGTVVVDPWPLDVPRLAGLLFAFAAPGYPAELNPIVVPYELVPAAR